MVWKYSLRARIVTGWWIHIVCWLDNRYVHHVNHKGLTTFVPWRSPIPELFQSHNSTLNMQSSFGTCHTSWVQATFADHFVSWDATNASHLLRLDRKGIPSISFLMIRKLSKIEMRVDGKRRQVLILCGWTLVKRMKRINNNEGKWWCIVFSRFHLKKQAIYDWRHSLPLLHWILWTWTRCFMTSVFTQNDSKGSHGRTMAIGSARSSSRNASCNRRKRLFSGSACCKVGGSSTWFCFSRFVSFGTQMMRRFSGMTVSWVRWSGIAQQENTHATTHPVKKKARERSQKRKKRIQHTDILVVSRRIMKQNIKVAWSEEHAKWKDHFNFHGQPIHPYLACPHLFVSAMPRREGKEVVRMETVLTRLRL